MKIQWQCVEAITDNQTTTSDKDLGKYVYNGKGGTSDYNRLTEILFVVH